MPSRLVVLEQVLRQNYPGSETWEAVVLRRADPFSYRCGGCSRCCYGKRIRVNPYEVLRLARKRGLGTGEFLQTFMHLGGTELAVVDTSAAAVGTPSETPPRCVFLTEKGCSVHSDRPLACRLYPLARHVDSAGEEFFSFLSPHPQTAGEYGTAATVQDYLNSQQAAPYLEMTDLYLIFLRRLSRVLLSLTAKESRADALENWRTHAASFLDESRILDVDAAVHEHCTKHSMVIPDNIEEKARLHLKILNRQLDEFTASSAP